MSLSGKSEKDVSTIIGPDVTVNGTLSAPGGILIYGKVLGDVDTTGMVRIAKGAYVKGAVHAGNASLGGTLEGDLKVTGKAELRKKSVLAGNLVAKILIIEEGASFDGVCRMAKPDDQRRSPAEGEDER